MQPILVNNFCDASPIQLGTVNSEQLGILIQLSAHYGPMSLHHAMTIDQAKGMAKQILELAYSLEATV